MLIWILISTTFAKWISCTHGFYKCGNCCNHTHCWHSRRVTGTALYQGERLEPPCAMVTLPPTISSVLKPTLLKRPADAHQTCMLFKPLAAKSQRNIMACSTNMHCLECPTLYAKLCDVKFRPALPNVLPTYAYHLPFIQLTHCNSCA